MLHICSQLLSILREIFSVVYAESEVRNVTLDLLLYMYVHAFLCKSYKINLKYFIIHPKLK